MGCADGPLKRTLVFSDLTKLIEISTKFQICYIGLIHKVVNPKMKLPPKDQ